MGLFDGIAESRIREAIEAGEFRDLPGRGEPLELEDLSRVPDDLRAGYLLLKGAGFLPEEVELRKSLLRLDDLIAACADDEAAAELVRERAALRLRERLLIERRIARAAPPRRAPGPRR